MVIGSGFEALADLAPGLNGGELKVLIELSRRQLRGKSGARISSRELAKACRIGRSNAQAAIDVLTAKKHIYMRQGTPTTPATYHVNIFETVKMGGPISGPPPAQSGPVSGPQEALFSGHPHRKDGTCVRGRPPEQVQWFNPPFAHPRPSTRGCFYACDRTGDIPQPRTVVQCKPRRYPQHYIATPG